MHQYHPAMKENSHTSRVLEGHEIPPISGISDYVKDNKISQKFCVLRSRPDSPKQILPTKEIKVQYCHASTRYLKMLNVSIYLKTQIDPDLDHINPGMYLNKIKNICVLFGFCLVDWFNFVWFLFYFLMKQISAP